MNAVKWDKVGRKYTVRRTVKDLAPTRRVISAAKAQILRDYSGDAGEHVRVLRLALNEAEALAWHTEFPHLFFHELAAEKAEATIRWHRQQRAVRRKALELAFAE